MNEFMLNLTSLYFFSFIVDDYENTCFEVYEYENETLSSFGVCRSLKIIEKSQIFIIQKCKRLPQTDKA